MRKSFSTRLHCFSSLLLAVILHPRFFAISKSIWWNVWCQKAQITETFSKLSWTVNKVVYFNLIEKYVCAAHDPHDCFHTNKVNRMRFLLYTKSSDNKMERLPPTREALQFQILRSTYAASWI